MGARCVFCFEPRGLVRTGCACRGDNAVVHVGCLSRAVIASGSQAAWIRCRLCNQEYTGVASCALAQKRAQQPCTGADAFYAEVQTIDAMCESQKSHRAEILARALLERTAARLGGESDEARIVQLRLAIALMQRGSLAEAERLVAPVLDSAPLRAQAMTMLARIMHATSRFSEAERLWRGLPGQEPSAELVTRVLLCETLAAQGSLSASELASVVVDARRVFGAEHSVTRKATALSWHARA